MNENKTSNQMWGGRFASGPAAIMEAINASISFDKKLYAQDIRGSIAHSEMLAETGIISKEDQEKIAHGLNTILSEIESGKFEFSTRLEDIHMNVEARLADLTALAGLHTARSRNDQVRSTPLWSGRAAAHRAALSPDRSFLQAEAHAATVMRFTCRPRSRHLGHHCMAYVGCRRDLSRVRTHRAHGRSPLGAAALAGTG